ncbi:MAG: TIGR04282 family arsenosugar biosynthesis glycosyltransferase [Opitutaceae bacterium]|nr:TIGR04282 family arsenosugar biosynthesis glycosyltransferase [Opitutaceae bacterium]
MTPALALLLKAPRLGTVKTRLSATLGPVRALAIYRALAERQLAALPPRWPVTIHFAPADAEAEMRTWLGPRTYQAQPAGDLGVRISAAIAEGFAQGAPAVIALGGDCPALDAATLHRASLALASPSQPAVLGPAFDGGYYLIGLRRACPAAFVGIDWGTPAVLEQTRERLRSAGVSWSELPALRDVDDEADWHAAVAAGQLPTLASDSSHGE